MNNELERKTGTHARFASRLIGGSLSIAESTHDCHCEFQSFLANPATVAIIKSALREVAAMTTSAALRKTRIYLIINDKTISQMPRICSRADRATHCLRRAGKPDLTVSSYPIDSGAASPGRPRGVGRPVKSRISFLAASIPKW